MRAINLLIVALLLCAGLCPAQIAHWPLDNDVNDAVGSFHGEMTPDGIYFYDDPERGPVMWLDGFQGFVTLPAGLLTGIQDVTTQTAAGTERTSQSIGNLARLAQDLDKSVAGFKLPH